jgi:hypothetical protein
MNWSKVMPGSPGFIRVPWKACKSAESAVMGQAGDVFGHFAPVSRYRPCRAKDRPRAIRRASSSQDFAQVAAFAHTAHLPHHGW